MYENNFYKNLKKPDFVPSGNIFKIVWPILYILMIISMYLIWKTENNLGFWVIFVFVSQLILNLLWSPVFFILNRIKAAYYINMVLIINVGLMIWVFYQNSVISAIIQIPYFIWLCFALYMTEKIIELNPNINI